MYNFQIALESAGAEIRAYETYNTLNNFLDDLSLIPATESFNIKDTLIRLKNTIVSFFKRLWEGIKRFFAISFKNNGTLIHKLASSLIFQEFAVWKNELNNIATFVNEFLSDIKSKGDDFNVSKFKKIEDKILDTISEMKSAANDLTNKVQSLIVKHHENGDYIVMDKDKFVFINTFHHQAELIVNNIFETLSSEISHLSPQHQAFCQKQLSKIMELALSIENTAMTVVYKSRYETKINDGDKVLDKPVEVELEID